MNNMYTKEFFQNFVKLWETESSNSLSTKLGITRIQVNYIAGKIRKAGYNLTRKRNNNEFQVLLKESLDEINFPKTNK